jgi:hypothetical protein
MNLIGNNTSEDKVKGRTTWTSKGAASNFNFRSKRGLGCGPRRDQFILCSFFTI